MGKIVSVDSDNINELTELLKKAMERIGFKITKIEYV